METNTIQNLSEDRLNNLFEEWEELTKPERDLRWAQFSPSEKGVISRFFNKTRRENSGPSFKLKDDKGTPIGYFKDDKIFTLAGNPSFMFKESKAGKAMKMNKAHFKRRIAAKAAGFIDEAEEEE